MRNDTTERARQIYMDLVGDDPDNRDAALLDACGDNEALRDEVEALLEAGDRAGGFLADPTADLYDSAKKSSEETAGTQIGRYKLLQVIGEGGFGTVWMAEQKEPVTRRVALKIIKLGMDTKQVIARFEAERQALAMMDHPNIAKVLDAGTTDAGRPYFVMEYIRGVPLIEYCDTEKLDTRTRLGLFSSICNAIQHAHQKGIIHRDIKPSNVLVTLHDGVPVPKVIDFGIAKATNTVLTQRTLFTEHRQMIGTPAYMSPEQAEMSGLDIDTRSDVYSLGVLLYELLTGTTPFTREELAHAGFEGMLRMIRETEPHKPSTRLASLGGTATQTAQQRRTDVQKLGTLLRGDLDWIVMKCLEKDRTRRYETANGLAADIARHISDEPVLAGPPRATYRLAKFVRRNRTGVVAACAVVLAITLGLGGMTWMYLRAESARQEATEQYTNAELAREGAAALNAYFMQVFGEIGWTSSGTDGYPPAQEMSAGDFLVRAIDLVDEGLDGHPLLEAEVRLALDDALFPFDTYNPEGEDYSLILSLYEEGGLPADHPDVLYALVLDTVPQAGIVRVDESTLSEAVGFLDQLRESAGLCDYRARHAAHTIGFHLLLLGRADEALDVLRPYHGIDCEPPRTASERTGIALNDVAYCWLLAHVGQRDRAEQRILGLLEKGADEMPDLARGWALMGLASLRSEIGRPGEEYSLYQEGLELYRRTLGPNHSYTMSWEMGASRMLLFDGRPGEAEQVARGVRNRIVDLFPNPMSPARLKSALEITWLFLYVDKPEEAASILAAATPDSRTRRMLERMSLGVRSLDSALMRVAGDAEGVLRVATPALEEFEAAPLPFGRAIGGTLLQREIAYAEAMLGNVEASRKGFERAREMAIDVFGPESPWRRWIELDIAKLDAGDLDTTAYMQDGWVDLVTTRE